MTVRDARFVDIPQIACLIAEGHQRSVYAETATFDPLAARQLLARALQRHGHTNNGGSLVLVSETEGGVVEGFLIAILDNVYPCLTELMATDLMFIMSERADSRDARQMLKQVEEWAAANPKVIELHMGITDAIGDWKRTAKLYERLGFDQCGAMFTKRLER